MLTGQWEASDSAAVPNLPNAPAEIECDRQKFQAALTYSERALAIEKTHLNRFTGEMASRIRLKTLALLGELRRLQGDYVRAESDLQEAVRLAVGEFGETSQESAQALSELGVLHKDCGPFTEGLHH